MIRTRAPPSPEDSSTTSRASSPWYAGGIILSLAGRFTQSWTPWNTPPETTSSSGGVSMCKMPPPAVIHCVAPSVIETASALGVLVGEGPVDHVRDRLESTMRVPRCSLRLSGRVVHLTHLVHVDEGVEVAQAQAGKGPPHRESLSLEPTGGGGHRRHRALSGAAGVKSGDSRQYREITRSHSGHERLLSALAGRIRSGRARRIRSAPRGCDCDRDRRPTWRVAGGGWLRPTQPSSATRRRGRVPRSASKSPGTRAE